MKISEGIYLVGSGQSGFMITNKSDCHVYLVQGSESCVLIDAGVGIEEERILATIEADGIDPSTISHLFLTHTHSDHAGGAAWFKKKLGLKVCASKVEAAFLREADQMDLGLDIAI